MSKSELSPPIETAPVTPLGVLGGQLHVIDGLGQYRTVPAASADNGIGIAGLFSGETPAGILSKDWLCEHFPARGRKRDADDAPTWDPKAAGRWLIEACHSKGIFDPDTPVRKIGIWRDGGRALAHCGEFLVDADGAILRAGVVRGGAIYAAAPGGRFRQSPDDDLPQPPSATELLSLYQMICGGWHWRRPRVDPRVWIGWQAAAALGAFPSWRPHLLVSGKKGSGKSALIKLGSDLLGPISGPVYNDFSAAGVRQRANYEARAHLFDEAERDGAIGHVERVIQMARNMSGDEGSVAVRGTAGHESVAFSLHGAVYLTSIIPGHLEPQDRSRFVMLELRSRKIPVDPSAEVGRLRSMQDEADRIGRGFWLRMLYQSSRWDETMVRARAFVQSLGADARDGDTIGAIVTGWHLATSDQPLDDQALEELRPMIAELVKDARVAQDEGEGERCLRHLMETIFQFSSGERIRIADLVERAVRGSEDNSAKAGRKLTQCGMRFFPASGGSDHKGALVIAGTQHRALDEIFRGTRWAKGGHKQALQMLAGVEPDPKPRRIGGYQCRCLIIPPQYWPDFTEEDENR